MVEQIINDSLGNVVTLNYDADTDTMTVKNTGVDSDFHVVSRNNSVELVDSVIVIEGTDGADSWEAYSDEDTRGQIRLFWETNKVDKELPVVGE